MNKNTITATAFKYYDADFDYDIYICGHCAFNNPQYSATPTYFTHDLADTLLTLCDHCDTPLIDIDISQEQN